MKLASDDIAALANNAPNLDDRNLIVFAATTGMRQAEIFGLRWENVDLDEGLLLIIEQAYRGERSDQPKTQTGRRKILLADETVTALRSQREHGRKSIQDLVFPNTVGKFRHSSNFTRREWRITRDAAGLPDITFHDLRRYYVSHIRDTDLPSPITKQLAGHGSDRAHETYTYPVPGTESRTRAALNEAFTLPKLDPPTTDPGSTSVARSIQTRDEPAHE